MRPLGALTGLVAVLPAVCADHYPVYAYSRDDQGSIGTTRIWIGDGNFYTGPHVPEGVKTAFNFTWNADRRDLFYIEADAASSPDSVPELPNPTFGVANVNPDKPSPLFTAHSAAHLGPDDIYLWSGYEWFLFPRKRDSISLGVAWLVPADGAEGTFQVWWVADSNKAPSTGRAINLFLREI